MRRTMVALAFVLAVGGARWAPASAQEPAATPAADGRWSSAVDWLDGVDDAAARDFEASGFRLVGTLAFTFLVLDFGDDAEAAAAIPRAGDRVFTSIERDGADPSGLKPASVRALGDERVAYAGQVTVEGGDEGVNTFTIALLVVRDGGLVHVMYGGALAGDPLGDLAGVADKTVGREPGGDETPVAADGLREGGLWDVLPRLADLPEGFVLDEERVPAPFAPLPGQATPAAD